MDARSSFFSSSSSSSRSSLAATPVNFFGNHMPADIIKLILTQLPTKNRRSLITGGNKSIKRCDEQLRFFDARVVIEPRFHQPDIHCHFDSITTCTNTLFHLANYLQFVTIENEDIAISKQRLANAICLLTSAILTLAENNLLTITFEEQSGNFNISNRHLDTAYQFAKQIASPDAFNGLTIVDQSIKQNIQMARLADSTRSLQSAILNSSQPFSLVNTLTNFVSILLCLPQTRGNSTLQPLLLACANAIGKQINTLNSKVLAPIRSFQPQSFHRR